jgi:hypothetical protein
LRAIGFILSRNLDAKIWGGFDSNDPTQDNPKIGMHWTSNKWSAQIFGGLNFEVWGLICGNDPCITQLQTVVEKGFTNVLEVKNYQDMYRWLLRTRLCKKKQPFWVTITITTIVYCAYFMHYVIFLKISAMKQLEL